MIAAIWVRSTPLSIRYCAIVASSPVSDPTVVALVPDIVPKIKKKIGTKTTNNKGRIPRKPKNRPIAELILERASRMSQ